MVTILPTERPPIEKMVWCPGAGSNHRHRDFQSRALPTELPGPSRRAGRPLKRAAPLTVALRRCPPFRDRPADRGCDSLRRAISGGRGPCSRGCRRARARRFGLAAQRAGLGLVRGFRHIRPTWEERRRRASSTAPPTCRASASIQSRLAFENGDHRRVRDEPLGARRLRTPPGAAARALRTRRGPAPARPATARLRGRTIWTKPKPLTAVRSNGCGKMRVDRLPRPPAAPPCSATVGRSMPIEPPMSSRRIARAASRRASDRELVGRKIAVDIDQGHRRRRRDPKLAAGEADDAASRFVEQVVPAGVCQVRRSARGTAARVRRAGERRAAPSLAETRASGRFHGSAPGIASRVTSMVSAAPSVTPGAPRGSRYSLPPSSRAIALRPLDADARQPGARRRSRPATVPSSSIRASMISPSSTSAARVSPIPRSIEPFRQVG